MYGRISDPMGSYPIRVALAPGTSGRGLHNVRGGIDPGDHRAYSQFLGVEMYGRIPDPRMGPYPTRVALAPGTSCRGFHTVRGGADPGKHRFCPRFVGNVDI